MEASMPEKTIFPNTAPRYPNVWFYVDASICVSYEEAISFVVRRLEKTTGMQNDFGYFHVGEGCDAFARRRGLQPVRLEEQDHRSHDHEMHIRFYFAPLKPRQPVRKGSHSYFQIAASVHYEVDRPRHLHPYVDECPVCGCVGEYARYAGADMDTKNEYVHDPMGLELLLYGTVQGERVIAFDGIASLEREYALEIREWVPQRPDINTAKVGEVFFRSLASSKI